MKDEKEFIRLLKHQRLRQNKTQLEVSKSVGISRSYYSDIENGRSFPSGKVLLKINEVLPIFLIINDVKRDVNKEES
ncbi:helix-turn-helix domain-containing protein [Mammaliicoccus sciuri]|uniref:helix-turn-helix domain-containing protein n=1 Tax=Mammaliicoccus sciuri TaxID=1296 RepID=UPI00289F2E63|nr:helix-turn-helix transcriptional regulator [Mammaliicoccus sciuri]